MPLMRHREGNPVFGHSGLQPTTGSHLRTVRLGERSLGPSCRPPPLALGRSVWPCFWPLSPGWKSVAILRQSLQLTAVAAMGICCGLSRLWPSSVSLYPCICKKVVHGGLPGVGSVPVVVVSRCRSCPTPCCGSRCIACWRRRCVACRCGRGVVWCRRCHVAGHWSSNTPKRTLSCCCNRVCILTS